MSEPTDREMCAALVMREVLCELVYRTVRHVPIGELIEHPCRMLLMRQIHSSEIARHVRGDELDLSRAEMKKRAAEVLDSLPGAPRAP